MLTWEYKKDPDGNSTFVLGWAKFLDGLTVADSAWVAPTGITKISDGFNDFDAYVKIDGGVNDGDYIFINTITDSNGDEYVRRVLLKVGER